MHSTTTPRPPSTSTRKWTASPGLSSVAGVGSSTAAASSITSPRSTIPARFTRLAGRPSRTTQRLRDENAAGRAPAVSRVADLSDFPEHAQPVLIKSTFDQIMTGFATEGQDFSSLSICAEVAFNETVQVTSQLPYPNPLRTAVACHLLDRLTPCGPGSTTYSPLLSRLKQDVFCSIYAQTSPDTFHLSRTVGTEVQRNTVQAEDDHGGVSRLLNQATYYQSFHGQVKAYKTLREDFEQQQLSNEKQKVVLSRVIKRWQYMLVDRLFAAWKNFARDRGEKINARGAGMRRLRRRLALGEAFTQWRVAVRDAVELRMVEELESLKRLTITQGAAVKGDRDHLREQLDKAKEQALLTTDEILRLTDELNGMLLALKQRDEKLREVRDEKQFWRATCLHLIRRAFPADRTLRLPEETLLTAMNTEMDDGMDDFVASVGNASMSWSPSLNSSDFTAFSSVSTFNDDLASLQVQRTAALFGAEAMTNGVAGQAVTMDMLTPSNPFRHLLATLPPQLQRNVLAFASPNALLGVPPQLVLLAWINSTIQRGSALWRAARLLHQPSMDLAQEALAATVRGLAGGKHTKLGKAPFRNFHSDFASGDALLMLADALGCFIPEDFETMHGQLPRISSAIPAQSIAGEEQRERMQSALLAAMFKATADLKVQCALDALFHRGTDVGFLATHNVDAFAVCTGHAANQLFCFLASVFRTTVALRYDPTLRLSDGETFLPLHAALRPKAIDSNDKGRCLPSADECRAALSFMSSVLHDTDIIEQQSATKDSDEQGLVISYVAKLSNFETKWGWISNALNKHTISIASAAGSAAQHPGAHRRHSKSHDGHATTPPHADPGESSQHHKLDNSADGGAEMTAAVVDGRLLDSLIERARGAVKTLVEGALKATVVLTPGLVDVADESADVATSELVERIVEVLLAFSTQLTVVFKSYAAATAGEAPALPYSRLQLFLTDHALISGRYLPKKHIGWLFEALVGSADAGSLPHDAGVASTSVRDDEASLGGLGLAQFSAVVAYAAVSAAFHDYYVSLIQCASQYGANSGKPPISLRAATSVKLKSLCSSLTTKAGKTTLDEVQAAVNHPDVRATLTKHHVQLMKIFVLAAGQDDNPEMSIDEFLRLAKVTKIDTQLPLAELNNIFDFFAHDDGSGSERSLAYRDFLEALVVIVQHLQPSPLVPLSDRVNNFLRKKEGSFVTLATSAFMLKKGALKRAV